MEALPNAMLYTVAAYHLGYTVFSDQSKPYNLNIVGWRSKESRPNYFDDALSVYWYDNDTWQNKFWPITTLPGVPWLLNPMSPKGCAIMVPGQYLSSYKLGQYHDAPALQQVKPVKVFRDKNLDGHFDLNPGRMSMKPETIEEGLFGIHIHRAGVWSKLVGTSSAGCQVFQKRSDFNEFIDLCTKASFYWGNSFTYTLMEF